MTIRLQHVVILVLALGVSGCQRENSAEKSKPAPSSSVIDQAARQSVDAIKGPMEKAGGVEGTLAEAAGRTAERTQEMTPSGE